METKTKMNDREVRHAGKSTQQVSDGRFVAWVGRTKRCAERSRNGQRISRQAYGMGWYGMEQGSNRQKGDQAGYEGTEAGKEERETCRIGQAVHIVDNGFDAASATRLVFP